MSIVTGGYPLGIITGGYGRIARSSPAVDMGRWWPRIATSRARPLYEATVTVASLTSRRTQPSFRAAREREGQSLAR